MNRIQRLSSKLPEKKPAPFKWMGSDWDDLGYAQVGAFVVRYEEDIVKLLNERGCSPAQIKILVDSFKDFQAKFPGRVHFNMVVTTDPAVLIRDRTGIVGEIVKDGQGYYYTIETYRD